MNNDQLRRYIAGTCTRDEAALVLQYIQTPAGRQALQVAMDTLEQDADLQRPIDPQISQRILARLRPQLTPAHKTVPFFRRHWRAAASLILMMGVGLWSYRHRQEITASLFPVQYTEVLMPPGYTGKVTLDDGTVVTLNSRARLRFPKKMNDREQRQVYLQGEAYFQVAKNPERPFVVSTERARIRVLGTAFNVHESTIDSSLTVAVTEGVVSLQRVTGGGDALKLRVGDVGMLRQDSLTTYHTDHTDNYVSWESGRLVFDSVRLDDVARQLEYLYHLHISFREPALRNVQLSADMKRGTADYVLQEIATYLGIGYTRSPHNRIIFHQK